MGGDDARGRAGETVAEGGGLRATTRPACAGPTPAHAGLGSAPWTRISREAFQARVSVHPSVRLRFAAPMRTLGEAALRLD